MTDATATTPLAQLSDEQLAARPFDELVVELQRVVQSLEAGSVGLEESIELYKLALRLHAACEDRLRRAELTITELGRRGASAAEASGPADAEE
jgi:exodeoxyribonuclease VII small subunit